MRLAVKLPLPALAFSIGALCVAAAPASAVGLPTFTGSSKGAVSKSVSTRLTGSADPGAIVSIYANDTCTGTPARMGTAAQFGGSGLSVTVPANGSATFHATATLGRDVSACSTSTFTFTNDQTPPAPPSFATLWAAPAGKRLSFTIQGSAEAGSKVSIFSDPGCTVRRKVGSAADFGTPGLQFKVTAAPLYNFYGRAVDAVGNVSACSTDFMSYDTSA